MSIFLEAVQRLAEPQEVLNPKLVLIVGCCGLLSNIVGLFLFHEHGHGHSHGHAHQDEAGVAEAGRSHTASLLDESGNVEDVLPGAVVKTVLENVRPDRDAKRNGDGPKLPRATSPVSTKKLSHHPGKSHQRQSSSSRRPFVSADELNIHPASFRYDIIRAGSRQGDREPRESSGSEDEEAIIEERPEQVENGNDDNDKQPPTERSPLVTKSNGSTHDALDGDHNSARPDAGHAAHKHHRNKSGGRGGGGHSHGDLNMRGVFLHVMGDALGNIGVIASALIIWRTDYWWRFYSDPLISLLITVIILVSAIPLCKAASRILLQGVPVGMSVERIKKDIRSLAGIISCHHLHVWQLSDTKIVASLHIKVDFDFKGEGSARYMSLAHDVRKCLHTYGIHSSTIQPEFALATSGSRPSAPWDNDEDDRLSSPPDGSQLRSYHSSQRPSRAGSSRGDSARCLLECGDECRDGDQCCAPGGTDSDRAVSG